MVAYSFLFAAAAAVSMVGALPASQPPANVTLANAAVQLATNNTSQPPVQPAANADPANASPATADLSNANGDLATDNTSQPPVQTPAPANADAQPPSVASQPPPTTTFTTNPNQVTHRVLAGFSGQKLFEPDNIVAEIGDAIEVHFLKGNHSFAQSSFGNPCVSINDNAIFSGFQSTTDGEAPLAFQFEIKDKNPLWFFCAQGQHCQMGMSMAINQNFNSPNTLAAYKANAIPIGESIAPPIAGNGGVLAAPNRPGL